MNNENETILKCSCGSEYNFSKYCGAYVCKKCGDHRNLNNCFCGWNGGTLISEDEVQTQSFKFNGDTWEVDY